MTQILRRVECRLLDDDPLVIEDCRDVEVLAGAVRFTLETGRLASSRTIPLWRILEVLDSAEETLEPKPGWST